VPREVVERNEMAEVRDISTQALASHKCNGQKSAEVYSLVMHDSACIEQRTPVCLSLTVLFFFYCRTY